MAVRAADGANLWTASVPADTVYPAGILTVWPATI